MGEILDATIAQASAGGDGGFMGLVAMMAVFIGIMWFFTYRPQKKQQDAHSSLLAALKKGDEVVLNSGLYCKIHSISDRTVMVDLADKVRVKVLKSHISALANSLTASAEGSSALETGSGTSLEDAVAAEGKTNSKKKKKA